MRIAIIRKNKLDEFLKVCIAEGYEVDKSSLHIEITFSEYETGYCDLKEYDSDNYEILCHASSNVSPDTEKIIKKTGDIVNEIIADIE
jgi:hypothetical protein